MPGTQILFRSVLGLTVASTSAATAIACAVDTRQKPAAPRLVDRLMEIVVLGAGAITALLTALVKTG